jgi:hypothetical protein
MFRRLLVITSCSTWLLAGVEMAWAQKKPRKPKAEPVVEPQPQPETVDLTATELAKAAQEAAAKDDYTTASARLEQLQREYGDSVELKPMLDSLRPLLAMCHVRADKHDLAIKQLELALAGKELDAKTRDELTFWRAVSLLRVGSLEKAQEALGAYFANEKNERRQRY